MVGSKDTRFAYSLIAPALLVILLMLGYPLVLAFMQSFTESTVREPDGPFIGIEHYIDAFQDPIFLGSMGRSLIFVAFSLGVAFLSGLIIALLLNRAIPGRGLLRTLVIFPFVVSEVSVGVIWQWLFAPELGVINSILTTLSLPSIRWLSSPVWAMVSVIAANAWRLTPFPVLILLSGLQSIDNTYYEVARIDGASAWQTFLKITFPLIKPMALISIVYLSFASFNQFATIFSLTGGGPGESTEVMALYMYAMAFENFNWGYGSALAIILFIINVVLSATYSKIFESRD